MSRVERRGEGLVVVDGDDVSEQGSFNWYLDPLGGGHFVKAIAHAIQLADAENLGRLAGAYPQMVAAFAEPSWTKAPEGFAGHYNAGSAADLPDVLERLHRRWEKRQ